MVKAARAEGPVLIDAVVTVDIEDHQPEREMGCEPSGAAGSNTSSSPEEPPAANSATDQTKTGPSLPALRPGGPY
jgi:hypothetical protein